MSEDEKEVDLESSDDADKRAHHNALERKRRDHIKDSFSHLRDSIPSLQGEKNSKHKSGVEIKASRAQILNKATDYIQFMRKKNHTHQMDIDDLKRQNLILDQQVRALEKARTTGQFNADATAALLSTPDSLLSASPNPESILDGLKGPNSPLDGLTVKTENNNTDSASDEEYPSKTKRRKRDG